MGRGFFQSMVTQGQGTSSGLRVPIRRETLARPPRAPRGRGYRSSVIRRSQQFASSADTSSGRDSGGGEYVSAGDNLERVVLGSGRVRPGSFGSSLPLGPRSAELFF